VNKTILGLLALVAQLKVERQIINASFKKLPEEEAVVMSGAINTACGSQFPFFPDNFGES
jgi:hypothetical protein